MCIRDSFGTVVTALRNQWLVLQRLLASSKSGLRACGSGRYAPPNRLRPVPPETAWLQRGRVSVFSGPAGGANSRPGPHKNLNKHPVVVRTVPCACRSRRCETGHAVRAGPCIPARRRVVGVVHETLVGARVGASRGPHWGGSGGDGCPDPGGTLLRGSGSNAERTIALSGKCFN